MTTDLLNTEHYQGARSVSGEHKKGKKTFLVDDISGHGKEALQSGVDCSAGVGRPSLRFLVSMNIHSCQRHKPECCQYRRFRRRVDEFKPGGASVEYGCSRWLLRVPGFLLPQVLYRSPDPSHIRDVLHMLNSVLNLPSVPPLP